MPVRRRCRQISPSAVRLLPSRRPFRPGSAPAAGSGAQYRRTVTAHILPYLGRKKLARLTPKDVRTWLTTLRKTCQCCTQGKDTSRKPSQRIKERALRCCAIGNCYRATLAPATLQYAHSVLASTLAHAVRENQRSTRWCSPPASEPHRPGKDAPLPGRAVRRLGGPTHPLP